MPGAPIFYYRDKDNAKSEWSTPDGKYKGATWQDVHHQLVNWAASRGCAKVSDGPLRPWTRMFLPMDPLWPEGATNPGGAGVIADPFPKPTPDPKPDPDEDDDDMGEFSLFD